MKLFSFLASKELDVDSFEKELSILSDQIQRIQNQLEALKRRKRSLSRTIISYCVFVYLAWLFYGIISLKNQRHDRNIVVAFLTETSRFQIIATIAGPIVTYGVIYISNLLFDIIIKRREHILRGLLKTRRGKLDDLKKKTNYDAAGEIIRKYQTKDVPGNEKGGHASTSTSRHDTRKLPHQASTKKKDPLPSDIGLRILEKSQRTLQDRLLDYIIGSDHNESVEARYALICEKCFVHNGLAPPGCDDPSNIVFICRRCGCLNGRKAADHFSQHLASSDGSKLIS